MKMSELKILTDKEIDILDAMNQTKEGALVDYPKNLLIENIRNERARITELERERDEAVKVIEEIKTDVQGLVELDVLADSVYKIVQKWEATREANK